MTKEEEDEEEQRREEEEEEDEAKEEERVGISGEQRAGLGIDLDRPLKGWKKDESHHGLEKVSLSRILLREVVLGPDFLWAALLRELKLGWWG
ncbi:hypothetical protein Droror1_Dr00018560 [Drosera rotundifolia]